MNTFKLFLIFLPISTFWAVFSYSGESSPPNRTAAQTAEKMFVGVLPKTLEGGITLEAPKAEGEVLIFRIAMPLEASSGLSNAEMGRVLLNGLCLDGKRKLDTYFGRGGKMRFDLAVDGSDAEKGSVITTCPNA
jgi:hypothetical protein